MSVRHRSSNSQNLGLQLPPALQLHILSLLPPNDRALSGRLVSPDAAAGLSQDPTCTASLSQPLPPQAVPWGVEAGQQHARQLPFRHKLQLLCTAASSGSEVNLDVALALVQFDIFPELLHRNTRRGTAYPNPGVAAANAGHPQLLGWLLCHCPAWLAEHGDILRAAAQHCDLAGLQVACDALRQEGIGEGRAGGSREDDQGPVVSQSVLDAAAASATPDAVAKMEWLLALQGGRCRLQESTAAAAARSGDLGRLRWLMARGCPMGLSTLESALQHADLAVAQWLAGEAGCELPASAGQAARWAKLLHAAAKSPDGVTKLQWLRERGAPPLGDAQDSAQESDSELALRLLRSAAVAGCVEVVRHLLSLLAPAARQQLLVDPDLLYCAVDSGSIPTVDLLLGAGLTAGHEVYEVDAGAAAYKNHTADGGLVAMFRWLMREAEFSAAGLNLPHMLLQWPKEAPADSRSLLAAMQLLVGEVGCRGWNAEAVIKIAAARGELALVQYLLQQTPGYRPGWEVLVAAAEGGCEALLEWLVEQHPGCLVGAGLGVSPYVPAAARGDLGTLTALRRLGVPWGAEDVVAQAVRHGYSVPALRWLKEQGAPVGRSKEED